MIAKNVAFICGSVLAVAIMLTVWDEDVLNVEHILTIMTVLGGNNSANVLIRLEGLPGISRAMKCHSTGIIQPC